MNRACRAAARTSLCVAALALVVGCTVTNPQTTQLKYTPADGASAQVGPVQVASIMVVASEEDGPGALVARLVNSTRERQSVTLTSEAPASLDETFRVPPRSTLAVGPEDPRSVELERVGVLPGELLPMVLTTSDGESREIDVPVLGGSIAELAPLVPSPTSSSRPESEPVNEGVVGENEAEEAEDPAG